MTRSMWLVALAVFLVSAVSIRNVFEPAGESDRQVGAPSPEQAAVERMLERTLRESRTGDEEPFAILAPSVDSMPPAVSPPQERPSQVEVSIDPLSEGYSLGTYRGAMQRAPRTGVYVSEPEPNPDWLGTSPQYDAILDQAASSGRPFTFAVIRVAAGTDLQALNRSLVALNSRIEGSTGEYVRVRVPSDRGRLEAIGGLDGVLGVGAVPSEIKADEAFVEEMLSGPPAERVPVYITLMAADPAGEWREALAVLGVVIGAYDSDLRSYTANLPTVALGQVLSADFVLSVEPVPVITANLESSVPVMGVDGFRQYDPIVERFSGITGSGIPVGILDTGLNTSHMDIAHGRASICGANFVTDELWDLWFDLDGHGTHVFGTVAGAGRVNPVLAGIAPGLSHLRIGKVLSAHGIGSEDNIRRGMDYLSVPTNCSWQGTVSEAVKPLIVNMSLSATSLTFSGRGVGERKLDSVVHGHSQLYVVAQANRAQQGFSNYGTAKNSLAVGAVDDSGIIARFSSHGPTADGRLAPSVVGTGALLTSARGGASVTGHRTLSGTSMASPSVAGVAVLLMEARPEFRNRPALARARLMASAVRPNAYLESRAQLPADNTEGPGEFQKLYGLGLVSARTSLLSVDDPKGWLIGSASSKPDNDSYEYIDIKVPEGAGRLDVVLTWDEQPADTLTRSVLNNLDLWVDHEADCAEQACGEYASRSEIDNVEWLLIEDPIPGTYRIKVVPVAIYGESSTAAVAWKILRGDATTELRIEVEDTSTNSNSEYITVDVTVDASNYVASGTTLHFSCVNHQDCYKLSQDAYLPHLSHVYRDDGLHWPSAHSPSIIATRHIPVGEVAAGTPKRVQLRFLRSEVPAGSVLHVTASSWTAKSASHGLSIGADATENDDPIGEFVAPANDNFSGSQPIGGASGETSLNLALASREPGEPRVVAYTRTAWYTWQAPATGLFRFRLKEADSGDPVDADFALFTGDSLVGLVMGAEKEGNEISFAAREDTVYKLRIASDRGHLEPLSLTWESADSRPAHDDFTYAQVIEGESGSIDSTNEGATLESLEFLGGAAATVWFEWTAPVDGWWAFSTSADTNVNVFVGERVDDLRLVSYQHGRTLFPARGGDTYRIGVAAYSADHSGTGFTLSWEPVPDLSGGRFADNDLFQGAIVIDGATGTVPDIFLRESRLVEYTVEPGEPIETGIGTGWWKWIAPSDGRYTWRLDGPTAYRFTIFSGDALENLRFVGSAVGGSAFILDASGDTRYWIAVGRSPESIRHVGNRPRVFEWGLTPDNDERANAGAISGVNGSVDATLTHATAAPDEPADTIGTDSVWWQWRAPTSGWQRFWLDGHPLSVMIAVYPDSAANQAIADSERSFLANGRVELHLLAQAGTTYDIRLSSRPGVTKDPSATLRWEFSDAPAALAYKSAVTVDSLATSPVSEGFRWPRNLAMSVEGDYLFSSSNGGVFAFLRDSESGSVALALGAPTGPDESTGMRNRLQHGRLWWNARENRLIVQTRQEGFSYALPEDGSSLLSRSEISVLGGQRPYSGDEDPGGGSPDGQHYYAVDSGDDRLRAFRVDSPTQWTHVQTVSSQPVPGEDALIVPEIGLAADMAFSSDGHYLYVVTEQSLLVFSRDSSGRLELGREIQRTDDADNPFQEMNFLKNVSPDGTGAILFVSGHSDQSRFDVAVAAFDIATDPSNPAHLDTLPGPHYENDPELFRAPSHLRSIRNVFYNCDNLVPHIERAAVDIFCAEGFFVAEWNSAADVLEITDFAVSGTKDRFGNILPYDLGGGWLDRRQMAQSPDGAHVYRATSLGNHEFSDAIHVYERASAMAPRGGGANTGGEVTEPPDDVEDTQDPVREGDCYVGLLVGIGESCTYPGTLDEFSVNVRGRGSFLGRLAGIRIRINNETINGRVYDFQASHQGGGVWRIDRVAGSS